LKREGKGGDLIDKSAEKKEKELERAKDQKSQRVIGTACRGPETRPLATSQPLGGSSIGERKERIRHASQSPTGEQKEEKNITPAKPSQK